MMKIFEALRQDHDKQRQLMQLAVKTSGDTEDRHSYFRELKDALESHAVAEERHFYAPLMKFDQMVGQSRHAIAEHHEIDELIATLEETEMSSAAWLVHMKSLQELVTHHLDEEEHEFFQQAGKVLSEQQKSALATSYCNEMSKQLTN